MDLPPNLWCFRGGNEPWDFGAPYFQPQVWSPRKQSKVSWLSWPKLRPARKMCIIVDDVHLGSFGTKEQLRQVQFGRLVQWLCMIGITVCLP